MTETMVPAKAFELETPEEKEIVANALALYLDYLTQLGEGVVDKERDLATRNIAIDILGGSMKDTVELRQRLVKHVGFDPTHDNE